MQRRITNNAKKTCGLILTDKLTKIDKMDSIFSTFDYNE